MPLLFILLVIAGGMGLSVEAGLLGPLASQVGDLWATMSIFGIGAVLTFFLMLFFSPRSSPSFFSLPGWQLTGGLLGLAKGVLLCAVVLLLLQKLFGDAEFLRHSRALPYFNSLISQVRGWLPPDLISRFGL